MESGVDRTGQEQNSPAVMQNVWKLAAEKQKQKH